MSNDPYDMYWLILINVLLSILSLFGSFTIILLFLCKRNLRSFVFTLVLFLSISELFNSIANIMSINKLLPKENQLICDIQSVIITYTDMCSLIWMCIISYTIRDLMICYNQNFSKRKIIFILFGFFIPIVFTILQAVIYFTQRDDKSEKLIQTVSDCWCWIYDIETNKTVVVIFYAFYWLLNISNFVIIIKVISFLKKNCLLEDPNSKKIRKMIRKLYLYPIASGCCFLFATIHRFFQLYFIRNGKADHSEESYTLEFILYLFHGIFISIRGFLFFLIYGCDNKVKRELKIFGNLFCAKVLCFNLNIGREVYEHI